LISARRLSLYLKLLLYLVALVTALDLLFDYQSQPSKLHVVAELGIILFSLAAIALLRKDALLLFGENEKLRSELNFSQTQSVEWQRQAERFSEGVHAAVLAQFSAWQFTEAEAEVAKLLLRGYGLKEIASQRGTSDKTAQHQATSVYRKSGLEGRAALSAYFLENLLKANS
jgi:DNA-binding CsgD family transcriptional regulator